MARVAIKHFCAYLGRRNYSPHTIENYGRDLRLFFAPLAKAPSAVSWRGIEGFIQQQRQAHLAAATINRRLNALKHFFEYLVMEDQTCASNPVKPSHFLRRGRPLPKPLAQDHVRLRLGDIDWTQQSIRINQGKGRKDRLVYLSADALAALRTCLTARPTVVPEGLVFWNQKRPHRPLSTKGIQKKMERYAKAAGIKASCHSLRHTFASNLLEAGAEVISI